MKVIYQTYVRQLNTYVVSVYILDDKFTYVLAIESNTSRLRTFKYISI